jgi:hypothetical protein
MKSTKGIQDPCAEYNNHVKDWMKSEAFCTGEAAVKRLDTILDTGNMSNVLLPFSKDMEQAQYDFYRAEAELPGITAQFSKVIVNGLLRKPPVLTIERDLPNEVLNWVLSEMGGEGKSIVDVLFEVLNAEIETTNNWIGVDYPIVDNPDSLTQSELDEYKPFVYLVEAGTIINWKLNADTDTLERVIIRTTIEDFSENEYHPEYLPILYEHKIDESGYYVINTYKATSSDSEDFDLINTNENIYFNGERLGFIPLWPIRGFYKLTTPVLQPIIDKEASLYNKISRRNHLLYGAATYTPVICSDMLDEEFDQIVSAGLGSWLKLRAEDKASVLETPTDALKDMDRAISDGIQEIARLGLRMLSPETAQSGVALEIRNASQTAMLGHMNVSIRNIMKRTIAFMINWRFDLDLEEAEINFNLSDDFNPAPLGAEWLKLMYEWYASGHIPRSAWINLLKQNDLLSSDYDDESGQEEINSDELILSSNEEL